VPRIERGESLNAGVVLYSRPLDFLGARVHLDVQRLHALDPAADPELISAALQSVQAHCSHERVEARHAAPTGREDRGRRFRRLTAPRSTIVQAGPVHTGLTADPEAELEHLLTTLVLPLRH
jgi:hypothetical protein